jgi:serine/threonine protein kinase
MTPEASAPRYAIYERIASGGMASVHFGMLRGPNGFRRVVAVKRLHPQFAHDPEFVAMLLDEARLASRVVHPNVAATLDIVHEGDEVLLVFEYVAGEALSRLCAAARKSGDPAPPNVAVAIAIGLLNGLHAAHEAKDDRGELLELVHRDVSPHNILVGVEGIPKVVDFGVAKASGRSQVTREGELKGKLPYMAPEQIKHGAVSRKSDIWAASVVLWEMLTGERLFAGESDGHVYSRVVTERIRPPSVAAKDVSPALDLVVMRGLARDPDKRFATAREMSAALEAALAPATTAEVGAWVESVGGDVFVKRAEALARIQREMPFEESTSSSLRPPLLASATDGGTPFHVHEVSTVDASGRAGKRTGVVLAALSIVFVVATVSLLALRRSASDPILGAASAGAPAPADPKATETIPSPSGSPSSSAANAEPAASETPAPPSRPSRGTAAGHATRGLRPHPPSAASAVPPRGDKCRTIDSAGIWHVKPECL